MVCLFFYFLIGIRLTLIIYNEKKERVLDKQGSCREFEQGKELDSNC